MRPSILDPYFASLTLLGGIGPKYKLLFDKLLADPGEEARVADLLFHLPRGGIDRRVKGGIAEAPPGEAVTVRVTPVQHRPPPPGGRTPYRVLAQDGTGEVTLVFFKAQSGWMEKLLPIGEERFVSGKIELWDGRRQMVHPDRVLDAKAFDALPQVEPIYGLTEGLTGKMVGKAVQTALERTPALPEWQDEAWLARSGFPAFREALAHIHAPEADGLTAEQLAAHPARRRLAYDELLATQLALALVRAQGKRAAGRAIRTEGRLAQRILAALPFSLTGSQEKALADIRADLASSRRMLRLLQGDVGSGKTVVGLLAMAHMAEAGRQAVMMAPTDILARQHAARLKPLAEAAGLLRVEVLTGRDKGKERKRVLEGLASGEVHIAVGTHALFQGGVAFHDLGLAVIDEQHRFGVHQRLTLGSKGEAVDMLVMTATPIPRTLALTYFGDMDVSVLSEKPAGRKPIATKAMPLERLDEVVGAVGRAMADGARIYWVCPLVAESEVLDVAAAEARFEDLQRVFGKRVGLLHGKMTGRDKDAAMALFVAGETTLLIATTVIEVGVDVPEATVMVIEHAERFGLSQLHQLRGRIGRGRDASTCLLLYKAPLGETAKARLAVMRETEDGFRIADEDLRLRGEGEMLGTRQSGAPDFRLADMAVDAALIATARDDARLVVETDPELKGRRGEALRILLYLFERDAAIRLLRAG